MAAAAQPAPSPDALFKWPYKVAKEINDAEARGVALVGRDFSVAEACHNCQQTIDPPVQPKRCSACKAMIYCSPACAKQDWKEPKAQNGRTHKENCSHNKRHMRLVQQAEAIVKQFPWGRVEKDGTLHWDIVRARFGVLGGKNYGYWCTRAGPAPQLDREEMQKYIDEKHYGNLGGWMQHLAQCELFVDGTDLLKSIQISDEYGWVNLPPEHIPYRTFTGVNAERIPSLVTSFEGGVVDWDSWYRWRRLPKASPAALLMEAPLSVYRMLVHCLGVAHPAAGSENNRVRLTVHYLGASSELNYIPLFAELALLLPFHDINLIMFGKSVVALGQEATKYPASLITRSRARGDPVFTYYAPVPCGSGSISVYLNTNPASWPWDVNSTACQPFPDAMIAPNGDLSSARHSMLWMTAAHAVKIPFAATEYTEGTAELDVENCPIVCEFVKNPEMDVRPMEPEEYKIELNPFHRPGRRQVPTHKLPCFDNGFTVVIYKNKDKVVTPMPVI